jgi:hypothetical protein
MEASTIKVKDLLSTTEWTAIWSFMSVHYDLSTAAEKTYQDIYLSLDKITVKPSDLVLYIEIFFENGNRYADIAGYNDIEPNGYFMSASPWEQWLDLSIAKETLTKLDSNEIMGHYLHEMTWFGSSDEDIIESFSTTEEPNNIN